MQLLPFIFSLILALFFLVAKMNQENAVNLFLYKSLRKRAACHLDLLKKGEQSAFYLSVKPFYKKKASLKNSEKKVNSRSMLKESSKLSLAFFDQVLDENTYLFAKQKLNKVLNFYYPHINSCFVDELIEAYINSNKEDLAQLKFKNLENQKIFFELISSKQVPLYQILSVAKLEGKALFNFFDTQSSHLQFLFSKNVADWIFEMEDKENPKTLTRGEWQLHLGQKLPDWNPVFWAHIVTFTSKEKKVIIKSFSKQDPSCFFYFGK